MQQRIHARALADAAHELGLAGAELAHQGHGVARLEQRAESHHELDSQDLGELDDRAPFKIAGAIVQVEKKFTRKEGKPFAVVWVEDLTDTLEVVVWNEVYLKVSDSLAAGRVIEIRGTLDKREEVLRATAMEIRMLAPGRTNGANEESADARQEPAVLLQFSPAATGDELRQVRQILVSSPGRRPVQLLFDRANGNSLRLDVGTDFRVNLTPDVEEKLSRWLVTVKR